jgi:hypothetical protein
MPSEGYNRTGEKDLYENSKLIIYTFKIIFLQSQTLDIHMLGEKTHFVKTIQINTQSIRSNI